MPPSNSTLTDLVSRALELGRRLEIHKEMYRRWKGGAIGAGILLFLWEEL